MFFQRLFSALGKKNKPKQISRPSTELDYVFDKVKSIGDECGQRVLLVKAELMRALRHAEEQLPGVVEEHFDGDYSALWPFHKVDAVQETLGTTLPCTVHYYVVSPDRITIELIMSDGYRNSTERGFFIRESDWKEFCNPQLNQTVDIYLTKKGVVNLKTNIYRSTL